MVINYVLLVIGMYLQNPKHWIKKLKLRKGGQLLAMLWQFFSYIDSYEQDIKKSLPVFEPEDHFQIKINIQITNSNNIQIS